MTENAETCRRFNTLHVIYLNIESCWCIYIYIYIYICCFKGGSFIIRKVMALKLWIFETKYHPPVLNPYPANVKNMVSS